MAKLNDTPTARDRLHTAVYETLRHLETHDLPADDAMTVAFAERANRLLSDIEAAEDSAPTAPITPAEYVFIYVPNSNATELLAGAWGVTETLNDAPTFDDLPSTTQYLVQGLRGLLKPVVDALYNCPVQIDQKVRQALVGEVAE